MDGYDDIKLLSEILERKNKKDLSKILLGAYGEIEESTQYGSYLFSILSTYVIYLPLDNYYKVKEISEENMGILLESTREIYPPGPEKPEITSIEFRILRDLKMEERVNTTQKKGLRAFIGYSNINKDVGADVKKMLKDFGIDGFLAHDDINVSEEWKKRILEELNQANIFIPILSVAFKKSDWTSQEAGIAVNEEMLIIPLCIDETIPFGFINHIQGKNISKGISWDILIKPIIDKFPTQIIPRTIRILADSKSFHYAEAVMELLVPHFNKFRKEDIEGFIDASINNGQIWSADKCRKEYLPQFLAMHKDKIDSNKLKVLSYQIEKDEKYRGDLKAE